jgi:hypothetical protein
MAASRRLREGFSVSDLVIFLMTVISFINIASAYKIVSFSGNQTVEEGGAVRLLCRSDAYFEYCYWTHENTARKCNFEWKRGPNKVSRDNNK